jgi:hypothetical protein
VLKRVKHGLRVTALALGLAVSIACAFFVGSFMVDGSHTGTTGRGGTGTKTLPMNVSFPDGQLTPTQAVPLTATLNNTTSKTLKFTKMTTTITTGAAGCNPAWFRLRSSSNRWNEIFSGSTMPREYLYAPGTHSIGDEVGVESPPTFTLEMTEPGVDQSACESANVTVALKLTE